MLLEDKQAELKEAFEQPGPDMPGEPDPEVPAEEPFDPREYFLSGNLKGAERLVWLEKRMNQRRDDDYYLVPDVHTGTYSGFEDQANYEHFAKTYSWLNYKSEVIGFHRYDIEHPHNQEDAQDFEEYLNNIDDDEWDQFVDDIQFVRNGECLDDDRAGELRMEAENEYFKDNYTDFIKALRKQPWMHRNEYQWMLHAVGKLDQSDVGLLCSKHEHYPESEGDGNVYLNFENAAKDIDPDDLIEVFNASEVWQQPEAEAEWQDVKSKVWNEQTSTGYLFDKEMRAQLASQPDLLAQYEQMDGRDSRAFFDRVLSDAAEEPKANDYPRWIFLKADYYDRSQGDKWVVMCPVDDWHRLSSDIKADHIRASMEEFVQDYALPAFAKNTHKIPKEHPELDLSGTPLNQPPLPAQESVEEVSEAGEPLTATPIPIIDWLAVQGFKQCANDFWQMEDNQHQVTVQRNVYRDGDVWTVWDYNMSGKEQQYRWAVEEDNLPFLRLLRKVKNCELVQEAAPAEPLPPASDPDDFDVRSYFTTPYDTGKLVKDTPTLRIIKPTAETVERLRVDNHVSRIMSDPAFQTFMVLPKVGDKKRFLIAISGNGTLVTPPFPVSFTNEVLNDREFSTDLRRFFRSQATQFFRDGNAHEGVRMLAQLYGGEAIAKRLDKYDLPSDLKLKIGIDAAKRGDTKTASKLLDHSAKLMTVDGCSWIFSDYSDLSQFFEHTHQRSAESILSGDSVDASWVYDNKPEVKEILRYITKDHYKIIREVLPNRTIRPYDDSEPVMLTTDLLKEFSDKDIGAWLAYDIEDVDPEGELEDIRDALQNAACDAWESAVRDDVFEGYKNAALEAISADAEWGNDKMVVTIGWKAIEAWLDEAEERADNLQDLLDYHSPRATPSDDYNTTSWDETTALDDLIDSRLSELDTPPYPYDPNQMTMPDVLGPNPEEYVDVTSYNQHSLHGYKTKMKRKEMDRWNRDEPWRLDPDKWAAYAKEQGIEIPPKEVPPAPSVGESIAHLILEKTYDYAVALLEVPAPQSDFIFEWGRLNVPDEKLDFSDPDTNPRETEQHVTVLYGMTTNEVPPELRAITEDMKPFPVYIGKVSLFRNETNDVVKLDVESPWLRKLNAEIRAAVPNENKYPDYKPHLTVAYVKKGSCDELEGMDIFASGQQSGVDPQFIAYGLVFKGAGEDKGSRSHETLLFSRVKRTRPEESEPFTGVPFPLDPEHVGQFLKVTRNHAHRTIL